MYSSVVGREMFSSFYKHTHFCQVEIQICNKIGDGEASSRSNLRRLGRARIWICDRFSAVDRSQKAPKHEEESYFWWSDFGIHFRRFWLFFSPSVRPSVRHSGTALRLSRAFERSSWPGSISFDFTHPTPRRKQSSPIGLDARLWSV